jgi:prevent-host-death family protein
MLKKISAMKARQNLGQLMNEVALRRDDYIVERAGKPIVAVIAIEKYQQLQRNLDEFYNEVKQFQSQVKSADPEEIDKAIEEAVQAAKKAELKTLRK